MSRVGASVLATLQAVVSDRYAVVAMVGALLLYSVFYPQAYRVQVASNLPVVVVDHDHSSASRDLIRRLDAVRALQVTVVTADLPQARGLLEQGEVAGFVVLPDGFERAQRRGQQAAVQLYGNGAWLGRAATVLAGMGEGVAAQAREAALERAGRQGVPTAMPLQLVARPLDNTREGYGSSVVAGVSEIIVHQTLLLGIGVLLGTRREQLGRRLRQSPADLAGMLLAFGLIALSGMLYYVGFTAWSQDYPRAGNIPALLVAVLAFVAATVPFGVLIGSCFRTRERALQYLTAVSIPMYFLAFLSWPAAASPPALVALAQLLPTTAGINAIVRAQQMGAGVGEIAGELLTLAVLAVLYTTLVWRRLVAGKRL